MEEVFSHQEANVVHKAQNCGANDSADRLDRRQQLSAKASV